eukprot:7498322-Pyramimonas_sp.AAC.1
MAADDVSTPAPGTKGLAAADLSPAALPYLSDVRGLMLGARDEVDWVKYEAASSFTDAGWERSTHRKTLAPKMRRAGVL